MPSPQYPIVLGHEAAGVVSEVGPGVTTVAPGDHVVCTIVGTCGHCFYCVRGEPSLCEENVLFTGRMLDGTTRLSRDGQPVFTLHYQGSFAEHAVVPERYVVPIRRDVPLEKVCGLACGVSTGLGAAMVRARVTPGSTVLVVGAGGVGLSAMMGARIMGAARIIAADILDTKLRKAIDDGFAHDAVNTGEHDLVTSVLALTGGRGVDFAFDAVGAPGLLEQVVETVRQGGTAVVIGHMDAVVEATIDTTRFLRQKTVTGTFGGSITPRRHIPEFVELYRDGRLDLDAVMDARYTLDEVERALDDLHHGRVTRGVITF